MSAEQKKLIKTALTAFIITAALCFALLFVPAQEEASPIQGSGDTASEVPVTPAPVEATPVPTVSPEELQRDAESFAVTELLCSNSAAFMYEGGFYPYIELENISDEARELQGWCVEAGGKSWPFPQCELEPGQRILVHFGGEGALCCDIDLASCESLRLVSPRGYEGDEIKLHLSRENLASVLQPDGSWLSDCMPTPMEANSRAGYISTLKTAPQELVINEVSLEEGFVELKNLSAGNVRLSDYRICLSLGDEGVQLPDTSLGQGQGASVFFEGSDSQIKLPMKLEGNSLFLTKNGSVCDYVSLTLMPAGGSTGRLDGEDGFFFFANPSPWQSNYSGKRYISRSPVLEGSEGLINGSINISLQAEGTVYYTTDGSVPSAYSRSTGGSLSVEGSSLIRLVALEPDSLPSHVVSLSFIDESEASLPALSVAIDDIAEWNAVAMRGLEYRRLSAQAQLFGGERELESDCSIAYVAGGSYRLHLKDGGSVLITPEAAGSTALYINGKLLGNCSIVFEE